MTRVIAVLLSSVLLAGAGPQSALPVPPPLPPDPPTDHAAPVPNANLQTPSGLAQDPKALALRIYRMPEVGPRDGYIPGSAYESPEQRKPMQPPGFIVTVPLK